MVETLPMLLVVRPTGLISLVAFLRETTSALSGTGSLPLTSLHELEALSILHCRPILSTISAFKIRFIRTYLNRLDMLFVIKSHVRGI